MDSSVSLEDRIWFLRLWRHIPFSLYHELFSHSSFDRIMGLHNKHLYLYMGKVFMITILSPAEGLDSAHQRLVLKQHWT